MQARTIALALGLSLAAVPAAAQDDPRDAGRLRIGAAELTLTGRVQTLFNTTTVPGEPDTEWMIRRARLEARVRVNDLVSGKIQPDFSGDRFTLKDAYVELDFSPAFRVLAGQTHRPFALLTRYSSLRMPPIEKGAEIRGIRAWDELNLLKDLGYTSRDIGVQVSGVVPGAPLGLEYETAILQGPDGGRIVSGGAPQLIARLAVSPLEAITVGASWSRRDFIEPVADVGAAGVRGGQAMALDLAIEPGAPGPLFLAEVTSGDFDPWTGATFRGAHAWLAYDLVPAGGAVTMIEPLLRVSAGRLEGSSGLAGGTMVTPGINLYLGGLNRLMLNYDAWLPEPGGASQGSLKAMLQMAF